MKYFRLAIVKHFCLGLLLITAFPLNSQATDFYWIGGAGNWNDLNHWATSSGGDVLQIQVPFSADNVHFDAQSGFATGKNYGYGKCPRGVKKYFQALIRLRAGTENCRTGKCF